jgi:hypothetical protein
MKSLLEQVNELDDLTRKLHKMESKMRAGQWIDAWRECCRIIAALEKNKQDLLKANEEKDEGNDEEHSG